MAGWTFLTNHARVLRCVADDPGIRIRDIAAAVGITERAAQRIVAELGEAGYLTRTRTGRRNHYHLNPELPLRHPLDRDHDIGELLQAFGERPAGRDRERRQRSQAAVASHQPPAAGGQRVRQLSH